MRWINRVVRSLTNDVWLLVIAFLSIVTRIWRPGLYHVNQDEMNLIFWSMRLGRHGEWMWLSNNWIGWSGGSWFPFDYHSPLNNYLPGLPYLFWSDAIFARVFVGLLGAVAVILVYLLVRRYFKPSTAVLVGLLLALSNTAIYWSRFVFHPMGIVFVALWLYSGIVGYYENRRGWMVVHGISLALAVQFHPSNALLAPVSLVLYGLNLWHYRETRRTMFTYSAIGVFIGALTFLPWIYGTVIRDQLDNIAQTSRTEFSTEPLPFGRLVDIVLEITGARALWFERGNAVHSGDWMPPDWIENIAVYLQSKVTFVVVFALLAFIAIKRRWSDVPILIFVLVTLIPPIVIFVISRTFFDSWYLVMIIYGAIPLLGIGLGALIEWNKFTRVFAIATAAIFLISQTWVTLATFHWNDVDGYQDAMRAPLDTQRADLVEVVNDLPDGEGEVIIIIDELYGRYTLYTFHDYMWSILSEGLPVRIVNRSNEQGVPLKPDTPTILMSGTVGTTIPRLATDSTPIETFRYTAQGRGPIFQRMAYTTADIPPLTILPQDNDRFSNGARILGGYAKEAPQAGQEWDMVLVWTPDISDQPDDFQFSIRVLDEQGNRVAQKDNRSLDRYLWRAGDMVQSPFRLPLPEGLDVSAGLRLEVLMYRLEGGAADVLNAEGQPVGQTLILTIPNDSEGDD